MINNGCVCAADTFVIYHPVFIKIALCGNSAEGDYKFIPAQSGNGFRPAVGNRLNYSTFFIWSHS